MRTTRLGPARGFHPLLLVFALASALGCGDGCACMQPIPGGFPPEERTANAAQVRLSSTGVAALTADPQALVEGLTGGPLTFDVPATCSGTPTTCCPGGNPVSPCGPIVIDLGHRAGDDPRLVITPVQGQARLDVTLRARVHTAMDVPISALGANCGLRINTSPGTYPDLQVDAPVSFVQDLQAGTTRVVVGDVRISRFTTQDYQIIGGIACAVIDWGSQFFINTLTGTFADAIKGAIEDQTCKACPSGDVGECGPFADRCTDEVCIKPDGSCLQELGVSGRLAGGGLFGGFSPGTTGAIDLYEVAGGYATTNNGGIALGLLGGMLPAGEERDRCGPPAEAPPRVTIPQSSFFQGNSRPDTGEPFDLAIGVHRDQLDRFAFAAYDGGLLCLTVGYRTVDLLHTGTFGLFLPSLRKLTEGTAPMAVGLRPQAPPVITLGANTFLDDGAGNVRVDEPLLDLSFSGLELDFFAAIEGQYIRLFTLVADLRLPIGLQVGAAGELTPVLGDLRGAFTELSVKHSEPLLEEPEDLAELFPTILELALGQLGSLGAIDLPELGGLALSITDITAVDDRAFLAIFGGLGAAQKPAGRVTTTAAIRALEVPPPEVFADPKLRRADRRPSLRLALGGSEPGLEWSVRVDGGLWSAWSPHAERTIAPAALWLPGTHRIEVRARRAGEPWSTDLRPVVLEATIADPEAPAAAVATARTAPFHGQAEGGCNCAASDAGAADLGLVLLVLGWVGLGTLRRRRRRTRRRGGAILLVLAAGLLPACTCGSAPCGDRECLPGEVQRGAVGRFNGVASDGVRTVVSTYDQILGDLVLVEVIPGSEPLYVAVDGVPDDTPTYHPSGYRGGVEEPGPDVGAWTSIALHDGRARIAYQDRDLHALKVAIEDDRGWSSHHVDSDPAARLGQYASLAIAGGTPVVAYLATGVADGDGIRSELRLARAHSAAPGDRAGWTITAIASGAASCAGLCGSGRVCVAGDGGAEQCAVETSDCGPCGDGAVCVAGACRTEIPGSSVVDLPGGAGLFPTVMTLADGRLAIVHYDRVRTALVLLVETAAGQTTFQEVVLDGAGAAADRGMWASAVTDGATIHVAYQDALGDRLYYTSWAGSPGPIELVDDGVRAGDRPHNVGAGAAIFLDGATPKIAYQDGLVADLMLATRGAEGWRHEGIAIGTLLDGFHIAATSTGPWLVWDSLDPRRAPPTGLSIREQP
jgi:hypothetical protein